MSETLVMWLIGGAIALLLALLVITRIARRMESGRPALKTNMPHSLRRALGVADASSATAATPEGHKKKARAAASVGLIGGLAMLGGVIAMAKNLNDDGDIPPIETEITAGELHGAMLNAHNSDPVVLIVPGSGPTDRNGNGPTGLKTDMYKLLADGLAAQRIASVRVDKRGMFGSKGAGDPNAVTPEIYANDYRAWIDAIRAERGSKCVWLLGHSEGALMVSLAAEGRKDVCGLILVAGMGRKMGDVIRQQITDNPANAPVLGQALPAIDALEAGRHVDTTGMHPALLPLFAPPVQDYLISMFAIDPVEAVRRANVRTLIIQGTTDLQVKVDDAKLLDKAPKTYLKLITDMNHVLREAPADRAANIATYADPALPLAPRLIKRIRDFIKNDD